MTPAEFKSAAAIVAKRNVGAAVVRVLASFEPRAGHMRLVYCMAALPTDDDRYDLELACAELIAEFPEILTAETQCLSLEDCTPSEDDVVFTREPPSLPDRS